MRNLYLIVSEEANKVKHTTQKWASCITGIEDVKFQKEIITQDYNIITSKTKFDIRHKNEIGLLLVTVFKIKIEK